MNLGKPERNTQNRVIRLFQNELGYTYLGDWSDRDGNTNVEEEFLTKYLIDKGGYTQSQVNAVIHRLRTEADHNSRGLYGNNQAVYELLRYGVSTITEAGKPSETIQLVNWKHPQNNDFYIAEEVTLKRGQSSETNGRRPDLVLYVNGIAIGILELKNSRVSIGDGIRQNLSNQSPEFNEWFFSTIQFVFAGNDTEGLRYGTVGTGEKYFLSWKEDEDDNDGYKLDKYLRKMCNKQRLIELMFDFVLFDGGVKKLPRVHQYFGIQAAQEYVRGRKGGIIWHTQGSGKSIVMVLLAKWILENNPMARVAIITDRDALDKQIQRVFTDAGEKIERSGSGSELMRQLSQPLPRLLCSLVHKFGRKDVDDFDDYVKELEASPSKTIGDIYVFVDECHRTQSGRLHRVMKAMMPSAIFIGFTGTPLLKKDKQTSNEVFGGYMRHLIDTYIEAKEPRKISPFDGLGLLELIVKTGIADAIAARLGNMSGNKTAVAETIENNVRSKIIEEQMNDPAFFEKMSSLLDEVIAARKAGAIDYEDYLKKIAEIAAKVQAGQSEETPRQLDTPGKRALYNNLSRDQARPHVANEAVHETPQDFRDTLGLALKIDETVRMVRPNAWRGVQARERVIKAALFEILKDIDEVERIFTIIKAQKEY